MKYKGWTPTTGHLPRVSVEANIPNLLLTAVPVVMAQTGSGTLLYRRNIKLDSFLKRNTDRAVYERIRVYEPCVVISETVNKVYMHVVLSDDRLYLTEYTPRTLTAAVSFGRVRDIELVSLNLKKRTVDFKTTTNGKLSVNRLLNKLHRGTVNIICNVNFFSLWLL